MTTTGQGKLIIVSAPSGAGKTTIVRALMQTIPHLVFSVSACSRPARPGEIHGTDYFFLETNDFLQRISQGDFLEWEEVYPGRYYGTLKSEVDSKLAEGHNVIFDVDVKGGLSIKKKYGPRALAIFIMPPAVEILEERLRKRATEDARTLEVRLGKAREEMAQAPLFDLIIVNDVLANATKEVCSSVMAFLSRDYEKPGNA